MFRNYLISSMNNRNPLCIYSDLENTDKFSVGLISAVTDDYVLISSIDPNGLYDGYILKRLDRINRLEYDDQYSKKVYALYKLKNQEHRSEINLGDNPILEMLKFAKESRFIVSVELFDSGLTDICGFVGGIKDDGKTIVFNQVNENGQDDGISIVSVDNITNLVCDSGDEQVLKLTHDNKFKV